MTATSSSLRTLLRGLPVFAADLPVIDFSGAPDEPETLFVEWLQHAIAAGEPEPHAMTLSTCSVEGRPDARVLIIKDVDVEGWWFATSSRSPKGTQLAGNPAAALTFHWKSLGRQVRIRGDVSSASAEASADDFRQRSLTARALALATHSDGGAKSRADIDAAIEAASSRLTADPDLVALDWTVYVLHPEQIEFWQADPDRKHHRLRYDRSENSWFKHTLWP